MKIAIYPDEKHFGHNAASLEDARLKVMNFYAGMNQEGNITYDNRITLSIHNGNFSPVICILEYDEAKQLYNALGKIVGEKGNKSQIIENIPPYPTETE